ncbi:MAG TPA: hypothetical protein VMU09_12955 [Acidimicrobiales bacterium]|nr:hypothetical protein [Acidimicrobiales bacterium]
MAPPEPAAGDAGAREAVWAGILDDMEARLDGHRRALAEGTPHPGPVEVPAWAGSLPASLRARAESVLAATRRMEADVEIHRQALRGAMRRTALGEERHAASYVDARA